ncbi:MAG TPA: FlgD immunoglobulin-like domain containing protein [Acidobacteriota bacterium]|nr:FlgD immunoglobulin-like domain containing protein [Acidobacteriota bacterium]
MSTRLLRNLTFVALAVVVFMPVPAGAENAVFISSAAIEPGESFVLEVEITTDIELAGWNLNFRWSSNAVRCDSAVVDSANFHPDFAAGSPPIDYVNSVVKIALTPKEFVPPLPAIPPGRYTAARLYFSGLADAEAQIAVVDSAIIEHTTGTERSTFATWSGFAIEPVFYPGLITIGEPPPTEIVVEPTLVFLQGYLEGDDPIDGVAITTDGGVDLDWQADWSSTWLTVTPFVGKTPGYPTLIGNTFGLEVGDYRDTVWISSPLAVNSPVAVEVVLRVDSGGPPATDLGFTLMQNRPNPFVMYYDTETSIEYSLEKPTGVTLDIYNVLGRKVRNLIARSVGAGDHIVNWDGRDSQGRQVASGHYFYRMRTDRGALTRRLIVIK